MKICKCGGLIRPAKNGVIVVRNKERKLISYADRIECDTCDHTHYDITSWTTQGTDLDIKKADIIVNDM